MKKLLLVIAILAMAAVPSFAQFPQVSPYLIDYFSNNPGPGGAADQTVRIVNVGQYGTPLTSPVGDICANIYVFDANQEMVACCSCRVTPNGLLSLSVANGLTNNPVTSVVPVNGAVKIISTLAGAKCTPLTYNGGIAPSIVGWASHIETSGGTAAARSSPYPNCWAGRRFLTRKEHSCPRLASLHNTSEATSAFALANKLKRCMGYSRPAGRLFYVR